MLSSTHYIQKRDLLKGCYKKVSVSHNPFYTTTKTESYKLIRPDFFVGPLLGVTVCYAFIYHELSKHIIAMWGISYLCTLYSRYTTTSCYGYSRSTRKREFHQSINKIFYTKRNATTYNFGYILAIPGCFILDLYKTFL